MYPKHIDKSYDSILFIEGIILPNVRKIRLDMFWIEYFSVKRLPRLFYFHFPISNIILSMKKTRTRSADGCPTFYS